MAITMLKKKALASSIAALLLGNAALAQNDQTEYAALAEAEQFDFLNQYCTDCHNFEDYAGGVDFSTMFVDEVPQHPEVWEKAIMKLRGRMMPPEGHDKPAEARTDEFVAWLESYLDEAAPEHLVPERKPVHRLNRKEYANAIRDLLGLEINPAELLPEDDTHEGFDNIADALQVSPAFIDQYVSAARSIAEQAVGDKSPGLGSVIYTPEDEIATRALGGGVQQFHREGLPLGTRGGMLVEHWFPADGEYELNIGDLDLSSWKYNIEFRNRMIVTLDGEKIYETVLGGPEDLKALDRDQAAMDDINARLKDITFTTSAGPHKLGVTFVRRTHAESDDRLEHFIQYAAQDRILSVPSLEIRGPFNPAGISRTPTRDKLFSCYPEAPAQERACAEQIITDFATRAYRRPLTEGDKAPLLAFYEKGHQAGGFEEGIRSALTRTLASPHFLYRIEPVPADVEPGQVYALDSIQLASRLSFFLWSSIPDDELLQLAIEDKLEDPAVLRAQIERMLADPKARALASNFAYQWLALSKLDEINPDAEIFPYASGAGDLRKDFIREIELFVDEVFRDNRSILDLLDADYTYLNERLAVHYDIHNVKGNHFRRVELADQRRHGLLGKGALLMASSYPNRTSPVLRGAYVLEHLMGTPPPVPPPDVEDLPENQAGQAPSTVRERLELHRQNPSCNSCHAVMDPLGFALDNFDATGRWRDRDRFAGIDIDASGVLPNGEPVNGPQDLRKALLDRPDLFAQSLVKGLMTYAVGRAMEPRDMPAVREVTDLTAADDYRFASLVTHVVNSDQFRLNRAPDAEITDNDDGDADAIAMTE